MTPNLYFKYDENLRGVLPEKPGRVVRHSSWNPYPISDQNLWFSLYPTVFQTWSPGARRVTSCYGTYTIDANIKREMVLSPNDEELASSKKIYPIQD